MRILKAVINYYPSVGGTQILFQGIAEHCVRNYGDQVEIATINSYYGSHSKQYKQIALLKETINGVNVRRFHFYRWHRALLILLKYIIYRLTGRSYHILDSYLSGPWSPSLKKYINSTNADVIIASPIGFSYMLYPLYRNKLPNPKPFVVQGAIHFTLKGRNYGITEKSLRAIKASEYYISNTNYEKELLVKMGVPEDMIVVIGCAIDMELFKEPNYSSSNYSRGITEDEVVVGYVGRLEATKGIDLLIAAFGVAYEKNNKLQLIIAGFESAFVAEINKHIAKLNTNAAKQVSLKLNISLQDKINLYHKIDILVLPSINESFGIVFLEAWSCKKPVIGMDIGAIRSVINDGVDGLLAKVNSPTDLAHKINMLAENPELRQILGTNGYNKTSENYTWDIVTKRYRDVYIMAKNKFDLKKMIRVN
jgi:glycosyltransferase involved in cell wall biosynthesis